MNYIYSYHSHCIAIIEDVSAGSEVKCKPSQMLLPTDITQLNASRSPNITDDSFHLDEEMLQLMMSVCNETGCVIPDLKPEEKGYAVRFECVDRRREGNYQIRKLIDKLF